MTQVSGAVATGPSRNARDGILRPLLRLLFGLGIVVACPVPSQAQPGPAEGRWNRLRPGATLGADCPFPDCVADRYRSYVSVRRDGVRVPFDTCGPVGREGAWTYVVRQRRGRRAPVLARRARGDAASRGRPRVAAERSEADCSVVKGW